MKDPSPLLVRGDARRLPLADESVDLIVTSPPYWSMRSYFDGGEHYAGQIGAELTAREYLGSLMECTREWMRVLKPTGSMWINLGDKYVADNRGSGGDGKRRQAKYAPAGPAGFVGFDIARQKSLMMLPHRYAIRCVDELGLILRQDQVWAKVNGLPESVTDRTRRSHEYLFHLVKQPRYYSAMDEIRESYAPGTANRYASGYTQIAVSKSGQTKNPVLRSDGGGPKGTNQLGKLPGSVWDIPSQPLNVPDHVSHARCCGGRKRAGCLDGLDHYAAFPFALVRPIILGWSPREVCTACSEGRRPVVLASRPGNGQMWDRQGRGVVDQVQRMHTERTDRSLVGYACDCPDTTASSMPGVVVDPFGGTAAAPLVAAMAGRVGISVDASWDYCDRIARWRINDPKERARAAGLDPDAVARIPAVSPDQGSLLDLLAGVS